MTLRSFDGSQEEMGPRVRRKNPFFQGPQASGPAKKKQARIYLKPFLVRPHLFGVIHTEKTLCPSSQRPYKCHATGKSFGADFMDPSGGGGRSPRSDAFPGARDPWPVPNRT